MMRPAFSSPYSAAAFALLLAVPLLLPVMLGKNRMPPREQSYASRDWGNGPYPWIRQQIFEETNDVDIVFMGSSRMFNAIYTPYVQAALSQKLGRPAVVRTLAWGGSGFDALYFTLQDLLEHRRVRMLVFYDEDQPRRNGSLPTLFRYSDNAGALDGLGFQEYSLFYFAAVVGMPRNVLCLVRPNLAAPLVTDHPNYWEIVANSPNPALQLGCLTVHRGYAVNSDSPQDAAPFAPYSPQTRAESGDVVTYSPPTQGSFAISNNPLPDWQVHFVRRLAGLTREYGVKVVMLYIPIPAEVRFPTIPERADWCKLYGSDLTLLGLPPVKMFGSLSDADVLKLFGDRAHLNANGQAYFTRLISPALLKLYENATAH